MPIRRGRPTCAIKKRRHSAEVDRFLVLGPPCNFAAAGLTAKSRPLRWYITRSTA